MVFEPRRPPLFFPTQWGRNSTLDCCSLEHRAPSPSSSQPDGFLPGRNHTSRSLICPQVLNAAAKYWENEDEKWGLCSSVHQTAMGTYEPESLSKYCGTVPIMLNNVSKWDSISWIFSWSPSHSSRSTSGNSKRLSNLKEQKSKELIKFEIILEIPRKVRKALTYRSICKSIISIINYKILMDRFISFLHLA